MNDQADARKAPAGGFQRWWRTPIVPVLAIMIAGCLAVGGAHAQTQIVLAAAVLILVTLNGFASGGLRPVPFTWLALFAVGLSCVQVVPFPSVVVRLFSPRAYELRSEVAGVVPSFMALSLDVPATVLEICKGLTYTGMLLVAGRCAARDRRARFLLVGLSVLGVLLALIAAVQRAIHTDTILGVYQVQSLPGSFVFGTFVNGNHAASVLLLAALVSIGLAFQTVGGQRILLVAAATVSVVALFFTGSRGGAISFVGGGFLLVLLLVSRRWGVWRALILAAVIAVVFSFGALVLSDGLRGRLMPADTSQLWNNQKTHGWSAAWRLVRDYPWTGVGRGAFEAPATSYRVDDEGVRLVYPENLPLQLLTEWGILATLAVVVMFTLLAKRIAWRLAHQEPAVVGAACGVLAVLLHDLVDFGLEMPGVALPTVVALGVVVGRVFGGRNATAAVKPPRLSIPILAASGSVWVAVLIGGVWASGRTLTADGLRARDAVTLKTPEARAVALVALTRHPTDYYLELIAAVQQMQTGRPGVSHHINRALRLNPASGETHALAARWLARFERRPQAALEFRLAREHGVETGFEEIFAAVGPAVVDAVPQRADLLLSLSQHLSARGHPDAADAAARRAVEHSDDPDSALTNVVDIAMATGEAPRMTQAAEFVLGARPGPLAVVAAVKALFRAGEKAAAVVALDAALARIPDDPSLILAAARLRLEFADPIGARDLLARNREAQQHFHLADLVSLQQLLAQIADQLGDANTAVIARARGRMFSQRLSESQQAVGIVEPPASPPH